MHIPTISTKQWVIILATFLLITIGIAFIATTNPIDGVSAQQDANILAPIDTVTPIPTPVVSTPIPTPTAPYKIIPRNSTYIPSKPPVEPIDANRTYLININPPFDKTDVLIHQGTIFEISGTTDLPVGSNLRVELSVSTSCPSRKEPPKSGKIDTIDDGSTTNRWDLRGNCYVEHGCTGKQDYASTSNTWRFIVDTQMLRPDEYFLTIQTPTGAHAMARSMITLLESQ
jgi:hypothetical protein